MNAIDTNVWIYSHDARSPGKQARAQELIARTRPLVLPWQVGCEFVAACRKLESAGFTQEDAWDALGDVERMADAVLLPDQEVWRLARRFQTDRGVHYWDAMLIAACVHGGVKTLFSEDLPSPATYEELRVVNPFV